MNTKRQEEGRPKKNEKFLQKDDYQFNHLGRIPPAATKSAFDDRFGIPEPGSVKTLQSSTLILHHIDTADGGYLSYRGL